jgi:hypothetical protein
MLNQWGTKWKEVGNLVEVLSPLASHPTRPNMSETCSSPLKEIIEAMFFLHI